MSGSKRARSRGLRIFTCGGTFDMTEFGAADSFYESSAVETLLKRLRVTGDIAVEALMQVDSAIMTEAHRDTIAAAVERAPETRIVITHGTDTVLETAAHLQARVDSRVVVFAVAFKPALDPDSDGPGNLASAITASRLLAPGVYLTAHGDVFAADAFRKNRELHRFERI